MQERLVELETRFTFAEQTIQTLSDIVTAQQDRIDALEKDVHRLQRTLNVLQQHEIIEKAEPDDVD